jgi:hypothetical protein
VAVQRTLEELFVKGPIANTRDNPEFHVVRCPPLSFLLIMDRPLAGVFPAPLFGCIHQAYSSREALDTEERQHDGHVAHNLQLHHGF